MLCPPSGSIKECAALWDASHPIAPSDPGIAAHSDPETVHDRIEALCARLVAAAIATDLSVRSWQGPATPAVVVALPATDENEALGATLAHLRTAFHHTRRACGLVVFANNCSDLSAELVAEHAPHLPATVILLEGLLCRPHAHAGWARRIALDAAAAVCSAEGGVLTTDADTNVPYDWVETMAAALEGRFDLVCGTITAQDQPDLLVRPQAIRLIRAESAYAALQDRIRHYCDQLIGRQPFGGERPHYVEAGASIGVTPRLYRRIGGLPPVPSSEDRALVRAAELVGARILYTPRACVETSNRLLGRASGGLAETLRRRLCDPDPVADQRLRPVAGIARMWSNAMAASGTRHSMAPAIRPARLENEWLRSMTERRMVAADLEREIKALTSFLYGEIEPAFAAWQEAQA